jgi:hypothetical protein
MEGSITKHGNPRVRHLLLEAVWRMFHFQPEYKAILYWKKRMASGPTLSAARKKKVAVAIARQFIIDWWRIQIGRMQPEEVGLKMALPQAASLRKWRLEQMKDCV